MIEENNYNTYCMQPECIAAKNALFIYTPDNYHVINNHNVQILHQLKIIKMVQTLPQNQQSVLLNDKNLLLQKVDGYIALFCEKLNNFVVQKYLGAFLTAAKTELNGIKISDGQQIYRKLQQGDHQMLKEYISCCQNKGDNKYPFYSYTQNKIKQIDELIAKEIQDLYTAFQKILAVTFEHKDDFLKVAEGQFETVSESGKQEIRKTFKIDDTPIRRRNGNQRQNQASSVIGVESSNEFLQIEIENSDETFKKTRKRKQITKPDKKTKQQQIQKRIDEKKIQKPVDVKTQITQIAPDEIRINTCSNSQKTFNYITQHYKDLTKIHIFHHRFAKKEVLKKIFNFYKNLKVITLNCNHDFESSVIPEMPGRQNLERIENLSLKWDFNRFFKEYHIFKYFPSKDRKNIENLKKTNIDLDMLLSLKNNQSLSVNNERQIDELIMSPFRFESIKSLHFSRAREDKEKTIMPPFSKILRFKKLSQLTILHLSEVSIIESQWEFGEFLKMHRGITTLVLSYCKISQTTPTNPVKIFQHLRQLPYLKKFSFSPVNPLQYVKAENIFCLSNLEEFHLSNCNLVGSNNITFEGSSMLREIQNLRKLTQFSLYACNPVFTDLFNYMDKATLERIEFLNIGYTQIDNTFATTILPFMKRLKYLNIDSTEIDGGKLLQGFQTYHLKHQQQSPLKYLSLESRMHNMRFTIDQMKELSLHIPNLFYIEISNCTSLKEYKFEDYKCLKYLAVDEQQQLLIQKKVSPSVEVINLN